MKISIVTICYNVENDIEQTILSVINQSYSDLEYIIIDGASKDKTLEIVNRYKDKISKIVSEPDKGIYDAMNKGILQATGEWVGFINAGDKYVDNNVLSTFFEKVSSNTDIAYGVLVHCFSYGKFMMLPSSLSTITSSMPFGHPASFVKRTLLQQYRFDCRFRIAADYDLFYRLYHDGKNFQFVDVVVSEFEAENGVSSRLFYKTFRETSIVNGSYNTTSYWYNLVKQGTIIKFKRFLSLIFPKYVEKWDILQKKNSRIFRQVK